MCCMFCNIYSCIVIDSLDSCWKAAVLSVPYLLGENLDTIVKFEEVIIRMYVNPFNSVCLCEKTL